MTHKEPTTDGPQAPRNMDCSADLIADEVRAMLKAMEELGIYGAYKAINFDGYGVRIEITRQE